MASSKLGVITLREKGRMGIKGQLEAPVLHKEMHSAIG